MKKVATAKEMQKIDSLATSSYGIEGLQLMENAGIGITKALNKRFCDFSKKKVLILATDGFEQSELFKPREALLDAGAEVVLASIKTDEIQGVVADSDSGKTIKPDMTLDKVNVSEYDALVLPGGVMNPDSMRLQDRAVEIVREFLDADKTVAAICHAPWLLAEAGIGISGTHSPVDPAQPDAEFVDMVFLLHTCPFGILKGALKKIESLDCVTERPVVFRIETL